MYMKLFISGGGGGEQSFALDTKFAQAIKENGHTDTTKPLLYIPVAMDPAHHPYPECLDWLKSVMTKHGVHNIVMWTETDLQGKTEADFAQFSGIYIGGGNTFKLLNDLRNFALIESLRNAAQKIPIYGGSAGAILLTPSIRAAGYLDPNDVGIQDLTALNLFPNEIWVHYNAPKYIPKGSLINGVPSMDDDIKKFLVNNELKSIYAIPEDVGIIYYGKDIVWVGEGKEFTA